jgi:hypothetical protein
LFLWWTSEIVFFSRAGLCHFSWTVFQKVFWLFFFLLSFCINVLSCSAMWIYLPLQMFLSVLQYRTQYSDWSADWTCRVRFPARADVPSFITTCDSGAPRSLLCNWYGRAFLRKWSDLGVKLTTHLQQLPTVTNTWNYTFTVPYVFMSWSIITQRNNFLYLCFLQYHNSFRVEVFWVVTPCGGVVGYQCFGGTCCLHLHGGVSSLHFPSFHSEDGGSMSSETLVFHHNITRGLNAEDLDLNLHRREDLKFRVLGLCEF